MNNLLPTKKVIHPFISCEQDQTCTYKRGTYKRREKDESVWLTVHICLSRNRSRTSFSDALARSVAKLLALGDKYIPVKRTCIDCVHACRYPPF